MYVSCIRTDESFSTKCGKANGTEAANSEPAAATQAANSEPAAATQAANRKGSKKQN